MFGISKNFKMNSTDKRFKFCIFSGDTKRIPTKWSEPDGENTSEPKPSTSKNYEDSDFSTDTEMFPEDKCSISDEDDCIQGNESSKFHLQLKHKAPKVSVEEEIVISTDEELEKSMVEAEAQISLEMDSD